MIGLVGLVPVTSARAQQPPPSVADAADRPGFADSPIVLRRGQIQFESGLAWERLGRGQNLARTITWPQMELHGGVAPRLEVSIIWDGLVSLSAAGPPLARETRRTGLADVRLGAKFAVASGATFDAALIGYVSLPVGNEIVSSGYADTLARFAWMVALTDRFTFRARRTSAPNGRKTVECRPKPAASAALGSTIVGALNGFAGIVVESPPIGSLTDVWSVEGGLMLPFGHLSQIDVWVSRRLSGGPYNWAVGDRLRPPAASSAASLDIGDTDVGLSFRLSLPSWSHDMNRRRVLLTMTSAVLCGIGAWAEPQAQQPPPVPAAQAPGAPAPGRGGGRGGPQVVSPQIEADGRVTFRILAPNATTVLVGGDVNGSLVPDPAAPAAPPAAPAAPAGRGGGGTPAVAMTKAENGVWSGTTVRPVRPGAWRYTFTVDGATVVDSRNVNVGSSQTQAHSLLYVPGDFSETRDVPHGTVGLVNYVAKTLGNARREMYVYTPPGTRRERDAIPCST